MKANSSSCIILSFDIEKDHVCVFCNLALNHVSRRFIHPCHIVGPDVPERQLKGYVVRSCICLDGHSNTQHLTTRPIILGHVNDAWTRLDVKKYVSGCRFLFKTGYTQSSLQVLKACNRNFRSPCIQELSIAEFLKFIHKDRVFLKITSCSRSLFRTMVWEVWLCCFSCKLYRQMIRWKHFGDTS